MDRYGGMDEILDRVRRRLTEPPEPREEAPLPATRADLLANLAVSPGEDRFLRAVDRSRTLQREAADLRDLVTPEYTRSLSPEQQEMLINALRAIFDELRAIESILKGKATFD